MKKTIIFLLLLVQSLVAFEDWELHLNARSSVTGESATSFDLGGSIIAPVSEAYAWKVGYHRGRYFSDVNATLWRKSIDVEYQMDLSDHRVGVGLTYHYDLGVSDTFSNEAISGFSSVIGYKLSYTFVNCMDDRDALLGSHENAVSQLLESLVHLSGYQGFSIGLEYEGITYKGEGSLKEIDASMAHVTFGFVF